MSLHKGIASGLVLALLGVAFGVGTTGAVRYFVTDSGRSVELRIADRVADITNDALPPVDRSGEYAHRRLTAGDEFVEGEFEMLPVIQPTLIAEYGGWRVDLDLQNVEAWWVEELPKLSHAVQPIDLPVPADWNEPGDYHVRVNHTFTSFDDLYNGENLTGGDFGLLRGDSYTIPMLILDHPIPWWWEGGTIGLPIYSVSFDFHWNLGELSEFDGG